MPSNHGTVSRYTMGCRCAECTEAARLNRKAKRQANLAKVDGLPCDMVAVWHAATDDLWAWWQANAEALIAPST